MIIEIDNERNAWPEFFVDKYYGASLSFSRMDEGNVEDRKSMMTSTTTSSLGKKDEEVML